MRTRIFILTTILILSICLSSCSKVDKEVQLSMDTVEVETDTVSLSIDEWDTVSFSLDEEEIRENLEYNYLPYGTMVDDPKKYK